MHRGGLSLARGRDPPRPHVLPAPASPALTRLRALRTPQLSLEAHARELFGAGPLGCARAESRSVLAARGLPLGDPHGREGRGAPGSTHQETRQEDARTAGYHLGVPGAHTCAGRGGTGGRGRASVGGRGGPVRPGPAEGACPGAGRGLNRGGRPGS